MKHILKISLLAMVLLAAFAMPALAGCAYYDANGSHNYTQTDFAYPSCTKNGYVIITCQSCGKSEKEVHKAYGHNWNLISEIAPTCTEKGRANLYCTECGESKTDTIKAKGHNYKVQKVLSEPTCASKGSERVKCSRCGKTTERGIDKLPHTYGEWGLSVPATDNAKGENARYCQVCGYADTESFYPEGTLYRDIKDKEGVKNLQRMLQDCGYLNDKVDGLFGKKTEQAVKDFQTAAGINVDGIAWPETNKLLTREWEIKMGIATPEPTATPEPVVTPEPTAEPVIYTCCTKLGGAEGYGLCEKHQALVNSAEMLLSVNPSGDGRINVLKQVRMLWEAELDHLYSDWYKHAGAEQQGEVSGSETMFYGYFAKQEEVWIQQYGEDSVEMLELSIDALKAQCGYLCGMLYQQYGAE